MLIIALVFLALGYSTKAACLQTTGTGTADQRVGNWQNQRAYYELCYSDTVPLYTAELLNLGKFPYKSSWIETDSDGKPRKQYDGNIAVRYMEYPVLTGIYQYMSMALAKTYTALTKLVSVPIIAEVVMFFNIAAFGLALAWLVTVWATARLAGSRRIWDAALVAASPILIFQVFTNFDALATAFATGALLAWARRKPWLAGALIGLISLALGLLSVLAIVLAPWIMDVVAPGLDGELHNEAVRLSQIMFPIVVLLGLTGLAMGILQAAGQFGPTAFVPVLWNAAKSYVPTSEAAAACMASTSSLSGTCHANRPVNGSAMAVLAIRYRYVLPVALKRA